MVTFGLGRPSFLQPTYTCSTCGQELDISQKGSRLRSKTSISDAQKWECRSCNVKKVTLHNEFGSWPPQGFKSLKPEQKQDFYKGCAEINGREGLRAWAAEFLTSYEAHDEVYALNGEFLPIKVWETKGSRTLTSS